MRAIDPGFSLNLCGFCLGLNWLGWMALWRTLHQRVQVNLHPLSRPWGGGKSLRGRDERGSRDSCGFGDTKDGQEGWSRVGRQKGERDVTDRISDCWKAPSSPDPCLGNRETSGSRKGESGVRKPPKEWNEKLTQGIGDTINPSSLASSLNVSIAEFDGW